MPHSDKSSHLGWMARRIMVERYGHRGGGLDLSSFLFRVRQVAKFRSRFAAKEGKGKIRSAASALEVAARRTHVQGETHTRDIFAKWWVPQASVSECCQCMWAKFVRRQGIKSQESNPRIRGWSGPTSAPRAWGTFVLNARNWRQAQSYLSSVFLFPPVDACPILLRNLNFLFLQFRSSLTVFPLLDLGKRGRRGSSREKGGHVPQ